MRVKVLVAGLISGLTALLMCSQAYAGNSQIHLRLGHVQGHYTGPQSGGFSIPTSTDLEYEIFLANQRSLIFRTILSMELETSKPFYSYSGTGMRYYFFSKGMQFDLEDEMVSMSATPRWRYYFGWDLGISQVIVKSLGRVLQITSTMVDIGGCIGTTYQIDRSFALEAHLGVTSGQGFSSVSVVGYSARALAGIVYQF